MKEKFVSVFALLAMMLAGCAGGGQPQNDACITVDVTADYPEKELYIQDIADSYYGWINKSYLHHKLFDPFLNKLALLKCLSYFHLLKS